MSLLRRLPTSRLIVLCVAIVALVGGGAAIAAAALSGNHPVPPRKALAPAIRDALAAKPPAGITARVTFSNHLVDAASVPGGNPLLSGATGRIWLAPGGRARLELQSENGDAQLVSDGAHFFAFDAASNTVYRGDLPRGDKSGRADGKASDHAGRERLPNVADIQRGLTRIMRRVAVLGPVPSSLAGRPAYRVRVSPRHDGGLLGAAEVSWDALRGVPLRAAVYAEGNATPVLELKATQVAYAPVPSSTFSVSPPAGAKVVQLGTPARAASPEHGKRAETRGRHHRHRAAQSISAVSRALPFRLAAPSLLVGLPRRGARPLDWNRSPGALVFYGRGLGGIAVIERTVKPGEKTGPAPSASGRHGRRGQLDLPRISINGATGSELATALGTVVQFERGGVSYTVLGSVPPAAAEAAARGL